LQGWGIVKSIHVLGDRRDHYESMQDVWEMFRIVLDERKRREIDPTLALLRECVEEAKAGNGDDRVTRERLSGLLEFFEATSVWYSQIRRLPAKAVKKFVKMGDKVLQLIGLGPV
jgi:DNA-binding transcriptional regulator GbsR (MarR family)